MLGLYLSRQVNLEPIEICCDRPLDGSEFEKGGEILLSGWALSRAGIAFVDVRLDGQPPSMVTSGLPRPDVDARYPGMPNAPCHGFERRWKPWNPSIGLHNLIVTAWSRQGESASVIRSIRIKDVVKVFCDGPAQETTVGIGQLLEIQGWAVASSGVRDVIVEADGLAPRMAEFGLDRPDVRIYHQEFPDSHRSGYRLTLDTGSMRPGSHSIRVTAIAQSGASSVTSVAIKTQPVRANFGTPRAVANE